MSFARCSGILMPLSSLPGGYGIGSMGAPARKFVDFLAAAGQTIWQILPVGPTGYADSPYQSCSAFAGNPYFIDLDQLVKDGLLTRRDFAKIHWGGDAAHIDYGILYEKRFDVLRKAYTNFLKQRPVPGYDTPYPDDWYRFQFLSSEWLPDYCLYMAIKRDNGMVDWQQWPEALRLRDPAALAAFKEEHAEEVGFWAFVQYEFDRQWRALHAYAKSKGVSIMGDIPIYVAADSADAWAGRELFETDADGKPRRVAGCPPDYFAADGQLWGNPCMIGTTTAAPATPGGSAASATPCSSTTSCASTTSAASTPTGPSRLGKAPPATAAGRTAPAWTCSAPCTTPWASCPSWPRIWARCLTRSASCWPTAVFPA